MVERFEGPEGRRRIQELLLEQSAIRNNMALADWIIDDSELKVYEQGDELISQNGTDNEVFFILFGEVDIRVNGKLVASRGVRCHIGEMAAIDPSSTRSASVTANQKTVVLILPEDKLSVIANEFPYLWRHFAKELGDRLRQRGKLIKPVNERPMLFIGCSAESLCVWLKPFKQT